MFGRRSSTAAEAAAPFEASVGWGPTGWRPIDTPAPWQQTGAYGDRVLSQFPARWEGAQRWTGVASLFPGWLVLSKSLAPYFQTTTYTGPPGASAGGQRVAGRPGDPGQVGPIAVRQMRASVLAAQVRQSGLQAIGWADQIRSWGAG